MIPKQNNFARPKNEKTPDRDEPYKGLFRGDIYNIANYKNKSRLSTGA